MKNYLYILCAFLLAFAGCTKDADVEPIAPAPDGNTQVVLTGFSGRGTRTGFGGAEDGAVPFLWSAGDYIWARNTRSEAIAEGGSQATFVFESLETADTYDVFYNLTGPAAATALIPAEQTQQAAGELNLGQNGDFGYATAQNGTFTLEHATSYVWFDTYSSDVTSNLLSITLSVSGGQTIAGEAAFADGKLGDCKGSSSVTLSFGEEGVALPSQSNDTDVFAAMVLYPADLSTATVSIVYKFADGSVYLQTKSGKTLTPGHTLRLSTQIAKSDCKSSGAFFMTEAGVAEELPTEPIGYLKVVTLGESTLSAEELTSIAGNLANGAVIDLGEATFATTEFPMDFTRKTNLQEIALPRNIQTFTPSTYNSGAFYGCKNLTRITFPEGLTAIGQNCFRNCAKLESIELPSSVRTLDIYAFYGCKLLTSVVIPEGVEAIPRFLFDSCTALTDVTLPSTLKSIGAEAFEATGLEEITIPESVTTIESSGAEGMKSTILKTYAPWQGAEGEETQLFIARNGEQAPADFPGQVLDGDARRIVCMSSTYIAMLDALGEPQRVVGVSGIDYISNPYVASHKEQIGDVGYDGNMNYERLLSLSPDIVLLFGVSGASAMEPKLRELGIPYAYMGEYLEQSPLGKAEWLVAVAEIAGMRERGEEVFREIPLRYDSLKTLAAKAERKPVVMLNTPYGDSWLMAPPSSYVARLIADAGGQYVYTQDTGNQSRPIDTEEAYRLAEMSDCWINVGSAASLKELAEIVPKFMDTRPVREGRVYNNNRRTNPSGGNDYWESGVIHPDLILQDLIRIFHPELTDAEPTYYRKLN